MTDHRGKQVRKARLYTALISIFHTPPPLVDQPCRRRILTIQPTGRLGFQLSLSLSLPSLEWDVPREFFLHRSELIPPPVLGFERFEENKYTSIKRRRMIVQCKEQDVEKNSL